MGESIYWKPPHSFLIIFRVVCQFGLWHKKQNSMWGMVSQLFNAQRSRSVKMFQEECGITCVQELSGVCGCMRNRNGYPYPSCTATITLHLLPRLVLYWWVLSHMHDKQHKGECIALFQFFHYSMMHLTCNVEMGNNAMKLEAAWCFTFDFSVPLSYLQRMSQVII